MAVKQGDTIKVHYTGKLTDGSEFVVVEMVQGKSESGQPLQAIILEVKENEIILDFNHPLAGQDLNFEIELVEVVG